MDESFKEVPETVQWKITLFINGVEDETRLFTSTEDMAQYREAVVADNPGVKVTFSEPEEVTEKLPTE